MAIVAIDATGNMIRVLTGRSYAIVTGTAAAQNLRVVDCNDRHPDVDVVAILADICSKNVSRVLASCRCAVVTIAAIVDDAVVIKVCRQPCNGSMTIFADVAAIDMRRMFASCIRAVVAADAITHNSDVIECSR